MLAQLGQAGPRDADIAQFLCRKPVTKMVIVINQLLTRAFAPIMHALRVRLQVVAMLTVYLQP